LFFDFLHPALIFIPSW